MSCHRDDIDRPTDDEPLNDCCGLEIPLVSTGRFGATWLGTSVFKDWLTPLLDDLAVDKTFFSS